MSRLATALLVLLAPLAAPAETPDSGFPDYAALREKLAPLWPQKNAAGGRYVVLVPPQSPLEKAAKTLAEARKGEIVRYSPASPEECLPELIRLNARWVAIFAEPKDMDANLLRKFIVLSTLADADPFCDFAFGFVTASTPRKVEEFVGRIIATAKNGLPAYAITMSASNISAKYDTSFISGFKGEAWYVKPGDLAYAREAIAQFGRAGFIHIGGCADPEGVWLFDDQRNMDPTKHWPFDPKKVGMDPKGEMPRITAEFFRNMKLNNAVVWTHACHLGAVDRVFVEGDIVSTFGTSENLEEYRIPAGRSVALAILDGGASAYIAPIGANHGMQSSFERDIATQTGVPLGDVLRRGYHDIVMDTGGHPEQVGVFVAGKSKYWHPDGFTNNNAPQHRVLYGDPMFAPFADRKAAQTVEISSKEEKDGVRISFRLTESGFDVGRTWYGNRGREEKGRGRFCEEIPVTADVEDAWIREVKGVDADGKPFSISKQTVLVEKIDGRTVLHVQLVTPDLCKYDFGGGEPSDVSVLAKAGATAEVWVKFGKRPGGEDGKVERSGPAK